VSTLFPPRTALKEAFFALRNDLVHEDGPRISTMRNYRFAIVPYDPEEEFQLRKEVQELTSYLRPRGWELLPISLQKLVFDRIRAQGPDWIKRVIDMERRLGRERGLSYLRDKLALLVEGPEGIAADCSRQILAFADRNADKLDRTLALIGRAGALYPFFRSSALLKHLDGRTRNIPVVLLYPGERRGGSSLSFMKMLEPDADYRPRIYGDLPTRPA
jgi:hypothetical protein